MEWVFYIIIFYWLVFYYFFLWYLYVRWIDKEWFYFLVEFFWMIIWNIRIFRWYCVIICLWECVDCMVFVRWNFVFLLWRIVILKFFCVSWVNVVGWMLYLLWIWIWKVFICFDMVWWMFFWFWEKRKSVVWSILKGLCIVLSDWI